MGVRMDNRIGSIPRGVVLSLQSFFHSTPIHSFIPSHPIYNTLYPSQSGFIVCEYISVIISIQAIDKLEEMLEGGMKAGKTCLFGPKEYVQIYT
jgi:hypothetical protein